MKLRLPLRKQRAERNQQNDPEPADATHAGNPEPENELDLVESDLPVGEPVTPADQIASAVGYIKDTYGPEPGLGENTARVVEALDNAARHGRRDPNTGRFTKHGGNDAA